MTGARCHLDVTLVLAAHGASDDARCARPVRRHAETIRRRGIFRDVVCVFWKQEPRFRDVPVITAGNVVVVPLMTADGYYARTVLPRELGTSRAYRLARPIGVRTGMADLIVDQARQAAGARELAIAGTRLLLVGHGTRRDAERSGASTWQHVRTIAGRGSFMSVHAAFLEQDPEIGAAAGAIPGREPIIVVPNLVADGGHAVDDIPAALGLPPGASEGAIDGRPVLLAPAVGEHDAIADLIIAAARDTMSGHVAIVGAGPGDPELITLKGLRLLRQADVVLYDRLAPQELLAEAPEHAERIDVGKHPGRPTPSQPWINELLVAHARRGRRVVRLKGGDPFVFGRGGEEALAVIEAGIDVEIVPGVTAGLAAPAAAGVPVTHRGVAKSVALVTAVSDWDHPANTPGQETQIDDVANVDTICVYMGLAQVGSVAARLIELGRDPHTPTLSISRGCTAEQREVVSTLAAVAADVAAAALPSPMLTVIGDVVRLRERLARLGEVVT